jgi:peptidyl-prolyl cis-trans isomerase SurA
MKRIFLMLFVLSFSVKAQTTIDKIVAKVDNYYILKSEVETLVQRSAESGQAIDKCQAFESLVIQKLMVAKAEIDSVTVDDDDIDQELSGRMQEMVRLYGNEKNIVEQFGKSIETLKAEYRSQVKEQKTAEKMRSTITEKVSVTPNEVDAFISSIPQDSIPSIPTEVKIAHIVRLAPVTEVLRNDIISRLNDYKRRIKAGEKFADLAKQYSDDYNSAIQGGDLGYAKRGQMVPEFEAEAMRLDSGQISEIIESKFGFHLIQTLDKRGQEYRARHILIRPDYSILDITEPKKYLDSLRNLIVVDTIKFNKAVKTYSQDEMTKDAGGVLMNMESGNQWHSLDINMEPSLYLAINNLKLGEISTVQNYRTPDGQTGVRIIKLIDKKDEHKANLKDDYEKLKMYANNQKQSKIIDKWFKDAMAEVYIKIDPEFESCNLFKQ